MGEYVIEESLFDNMVRLIEEIVKSRRYGNEYLIDGGNNDGNN